MTCMQEIQVAKGEPMPQGIAKDPRTPGVRNSGASSVPRHNCSRGAKRENRAKFECLAQNPCEGQTDFDIEAVETSNHWFAKHNKARDSLRERHVFDKKRMLRGFSGKGFKHLRGDARVIAMVQCARKKRMETGTEEHISARKKRDLEDLVCEKQDDHDLILLSGDVEKNPGPGKKAPDGPPPGKCRITGGCAKCAYAGQNIVGRAEFINAKNRSRFIVCCEACGVKMAVIKGMNIKQWQINCSRSVLYRHPTSEDDFGVPSSSTDAAPIEVPVPAPTSVEPVVEGPDSIIEAAPAASAVPVQPPVEPIPVEPKEDLDKPDRDVPLEGIVLEPEDEFRFLAGTLGHPRPSWYFIRNTFQRTETIVPYEDERRIVTNRNVTETRQNYRLVSLCMIKPLTVGEIVLTILTRYLMFLLIPISIAMLCFGSASYTLLTTSVLMTILFIWYRLFRGTPIVRKRAYLAYMPHLVSCLINDTDRVTNFTMLYGNVSQKSRRLSTLPIPDRDHVSIVDGSERVYLYVMQHRDFTSRRASVAGVPQPYLGVLPL